ncbi:MAG: hypothetical protein HYX20_02440 [Candidatus Yanofskybacteria bacterium]|nr:hypothetical protein [Candidatus Yanofskybacteria bacterium]
MVIKPKERGAAIGMRKRGFSYSEILKKVPVAKSTLSLWLKSVNLSREQKQRLTQKKLDAMKRGWIKVHQNRVEKTKIIRESAIADVGRISKKDLWLIGSVLYWAEGTKEKKHSVSQQVSFNNSDPLMIRIFLKWLKESVGIKLEEIGYEIYIHENSKNNVANVIDYWENIVEAKINKTYFKKNKLSKYRKNTGIDYFGLLRVNVKKSADLNRKIAGWIEGICKNCGVA